MHLLRIKDGPVWWTRLLGLPEEIEELVAPVYRDNPECRVYLYDFSTPLPAPRPLAVLKGFAPDDENHVIYSVESMSGAKLFSFGFLVEPLALPESQG